MFFSNFELANYRIRIKENPTLQNRTSTLNPKFLFYLVALLVRSTIISVSIWFFSEKILTC